MFSRRGLGAANRRAHGARWRSLPAIVGGVVALALVGGSAVGPLAPVYADAFVMALPAETVLEDGCTLAAVPCAVALGVGAVAVGLGWAFVNRDNLYAGIKDVWNNLTDSQKNTLANQIEATGNLQGVSQSILNTVQSTLQSVGSQASSSWQTVSAGAPFGGNWIWETSTATPQTAATFSFTVPASECLSGDSCQLDFGPFNSYPLVESVNGGAVQNSGVAYSETYSDSQGGTYSSTSASGATVATPHPMMTNTAAAGMSATMTLAVTAASGTNFALADNANDGADWRVIDVTANKIFDNVVYPDASSSGNSEVVPGYGAIASQPNGIGTLEGTLNIPNTIDQEVGAAPGSTITDLSGNSTTLETGAATGQAGLLSGILGGIRAIPGDVAQVFSPDTSQESVLEARWKGLEATAEGLAPFSWWSSFFNGIDGFFGSVGSKCQDSKWNYSLGGQTLNWDVNLCDSLNVLSTVREFSTWAIWAMMLYFGYAEIRRWFDSGGT